MTGHGVDDVNLRIFSSYIRIVNLLMIRLGRWISIPEVLLHIDQRIANIHAMTVLHTCSVSVNDRPWDARSLPSSYS